MKANKGLVEVGVALAVFVLLWPAPSFAGDYWLQIAFRVLIYLTLAESWNCWRVPRASFRSAPPASSVSALMSPSLS